MGRCCRRTGRPVNCATVLLTGFERLATITTNPIFHTNLHDLGVEQVQAYIDDLLNAEAGLIVLAVRHHRDLAKAGL